MIAESRTKKSLRNTFWGIILKLIVIIIPFINRTVIIRTIGIEYAGIASLFTSILSVLNLAELGISSAILFAMYDCVAKKDYTKSNKLLNYYRKAYRIIALVILIVGSLICLKIDWFIAGDIPSDINIYVIYFLFLLGTVSSYSFFAYMSVVFSAEQRDDLQFKINLVIALCREIIQFLVLFFLKNYYLYVSLILIATIIQNLISFFVIRKRFPQYNAEGVIEVEEKQKLKKQIGGLMIGKISVVTRNSFDSIVISSVLGLIPAAIYNNYYYIMISVFGIVFYFCSGMRASIGNKIATHSVSENYEDMMSFSFVFFLIYGTCTAIMLTLYQPFMFIWVGAEYTVSLTLPILMCIYFFLYCSTGIISQYWEGAGLFWENRVRYIVEAIINLSLDLILVHFLGLEGIILATIVSMFFSTNIFGPIIAFKHYFKKCSLKRYFIRQIEYLISATGVTIGVYYLCSFVLIDGIIGLFVKGCISLFLSFVVLFLLFSNTRECKSMIRRVNAIFKKKKKNL